MEAKDKRVKLVNELLAGIKVIKFYAWEKHFQHKVEGNKQVERLSKVIFWGVFYGP